MSHAGERMLESVREAVAVAKGEQPAASITIKGHRYVPDGWRDIYDAPQDGGSIILDLGESIPDTPIIACGSYITEANAAELGYTLSASGGWLIWTSGGDFYVIPFYDAFGWFPLPHNKDSQE